MPTDIGQKASRRMAVLRSLGIGGTAIADRLIAAAVRAFETGIIRRNLLSGVVF